MAEVNWSREPAVTPPATFTITLSEDEAQALYELVAGHGPASILRSNNPAIYSIEDPLLDAIEAAGSDE